MINNGKTYNKVLLLVIAIIAILGTQVLAATLTKVTGLTSRVTNNTATLTWNKVTNATGYEIQVKVAGSQYETIGKVTRTNVNIKGVQSSTTYYARVRAYQIVNGRTTYGEYSNEIKLQASNSNNNNNNNNVSLGQVTNLTVTNVTGSQATLTWNRVNNATSYEIYVKVGNGSYQSLGAVQSNSVRINKLQAGTIYVVKVRALNGQKVGNFSNEVRFTVNANNNNNNTVLGQVTNLKLNSVTETQANLSWNRVDNATSYEIYVKQGNGSYQAIGTITNTNVRINNLQAGTTYSVKVRALNEQKAGSFSNEVTFKTNSNNTNVTTLDKVTNLKSSNIEKTQATFTWNKVSNASGYEIYLKGTNGSYEYLGNVVNNNVRINNLQEGTTYSVKVRAYLIQNGRTIYGDYSEPLNFTTKSNNDNNNNNQTVAKVTNLVANINGKDATLTWNRVSDVTGYEVQINVGGTGYTSLGTTYKTYTTLNSLRTGTMYYAKVRAYKIINGQTIYGEYSEEIKISVNNGGTIENLGKVMDFRAIIGETSVDLTWNHVANAEGYEVYLKEQGKEYNLAGTTNNNQTTINNLKSGVEYEVKVRAYKTVNNQKIYGEYSDIVKFKTLSIVLPPVTTLEKVANLNSNVTGLEATLTWNSIANVDGYEIYVNIPGVGYKSLGTTSSNNVRVIGLAANTTYYAKVRAYKIVNNQTIYGEFSDETNFVATNETQTQVSKVTNLKGTVTGTEAILTWNTVSGATKYEIFVEIPGEGYKSLGTTSSNTVRVVNLVQGITYKVKVRAIGTINGNAVYGDYSDEINLIAR